MKKIFKKVGKGVARVGYGIGHVAGGVFDIAVVLGYGVYCKITGKEFL